MLRGVRLQTASTFLKTLTPRRTCPGGSLWTRSVVMAPTPPTSPPAKRPRIHAQATEGPSADASQIASSSAPLVQAQEVAAEPVTETSAPSSKSTNANTGRDTNGKGSAPFNYARKVKAKEKAYQAALAKTGEDPLWYDIVEILGADKVAEVMDNQGKGQGEWADRFARGDTVEGKVVKLSANGSGIVVPASGDWVLSVPHVLPGEIVRMRVDRNERLHSKCDLIEVLEKSSERRDDLIGCKYFGECPGCQYQMIPYEKQLEIKRDVVTQAFAHFTRIEQSRIPATLPTLPSPLQYAYRTKLTPHFELPASLTEFRFNHQKEKTKGQPKKKYRGSKKRFQLGITDDIEPEELEELNQKWAGDVRVGFDCLKQGGKGGILDIEECPIATPAINQAIPIEKAKIKKNINAWANGATILLRDSFTADAFGLSEEERAKEPIGTRDGGPTPGAHGDSEIVTSYKAVVHEKVEGVRFETPSNAFFQNNRSVLPGLLGYVRESIVEARRGQGNEEQEHYLVDTYCGSGLFALALAPLFKSVAGVEISQDSIVFAKRNAELNGIKNVEFLAGNAEDIFGTIDYPSARTTVVIDPPRRGCDEAFIKQLVKLSPALVVYISCNVHTQARDVGSLLKLAPEYEIVSVRGADLFPQTHHVEGVCVLRKKDAVLTD